MWYGATTESAAWAELAKRASGGQGLVQRRLVSVDASRLHVLDLTDPNVRSALEVDLPDLTGDDYTLPQTIAAWTRERGFDGIVAPSAVESGAGTLVVFGEAVGKLTVASDAIRVPPA